VALPGGVVLLPLVQDHSAVVADHLVRPSCEK
jgi:hypothetical protein